MDVLSLASRNFAFTHHEIDLLKNVTDRDCFEEVILFSSGNQLAIDLMTICMQYILDDNSSSSVESMLASFLGFEIFYTEEVTCNL